MTSARLVGWGLFTVWSVWSFALQGALGGGGSAGRWTPDLGLVLALSLLARLDARDAPWLVLCVALARATLGIEPPIVLLAGVGLVVALALTARSVVELASPLWRAVVATALVFVFDAWLILVHHVRAGTFAAGEGAATLDLFAAWPVALSSGAFAFAAGALLAYLPGLTPLRSRRW